MFYPLVEENYNSRDVINTFLGYNHTEAAQDGEFYDMRNLSSDEFPLLSPRAPRKVLLSLASRDWEDMDVTVTGQYYGELSESYCLYTTSIFPINGVNYESVTFDMSDSIGEVRVIVTYMDANQKVLRTEEYDGATTFISKGDVAYGRVQIYAYPEEDESMRPEDVDTYIMDVHVLVYNDHIRGMIIKNQQLAYMISTTLYYGSEWYDMSAYIGEEDDHNSRQQLLSFGVYILIFPLGLYFNTINPEDRGYLGASFALLGASLTFSPVDLYGNNISSKITYSKTDPGASTVGEGAYWVDQSGDTIAMYQSTGYSWVAVSTSYMRISIDDSSIDLTQNFKEGDAVYMNTSQEYINDGSVIQKLEKNALTVIAFPENNTSSQTFPSGKAFTIERRIPQLDYVCEYNNRVWGCYYGYTDDGFVNEIYACKQGDPTNWYDFTTLLGSYTASVGSDGPFTGAISYQGYPTFFKENVIYRVFGTLPSNFQVVMLDARGVQLGSERSLAVCGEYLIYKSMADICVFDGSNPSSISGALGSEVYTDAVAGSAMNKYYISMTDSNGEAQLLVYDMAKGIWMKEDELRIEEFDYSNAGQLYGQNGLQIYGFGLAADYLSMTAEQAEEYVQWSAETAKMGFEYPDHKYVTKLTIRAHIPFGCEIRISISHNSEKFQEVCVLRGNDRINSQSVDIRPERCDHYQLKFEGHGNVKIYSITRTLEVGDDA